MWDTVTWFNLIKRYSELVHCVHGLWNNPDTKNYISTSVFALVNRMGRKQKEVRKIGKHTEEEIKKGLELMKWGKSLHYSAEAAGIPYPTFWRYWVKSKAMDQPVRLVPYYDVNRIFNKSQKRALEDYIEICIFVLWTFDLRIPQNGISDGHSKQYKSADILAC